MQEELGLNIQSPENEEPIFIVGFPRSGTTLLQLIVASHPGIGSAPETHYYNHVLHPIPQDHWDRLSLGEVQIIVDRFSRKPSLEIPESLETALKRSVSQDGLDTSTILHNVMQAIGQEACRRRWVEKTPRHSGHIQDILRDFPRAKVLLLLRDPRDAIASLLVGHDPHPTGAEAVGYLMKQIRAWNSEIHQVYQTVREESSCLVVRYEDIVKSPPSVVTKIFKFLGEEPPKNYEEGFSEGYRDVIVDWEHDHKKRASVGEIRDRRGVWKERLTPFQARLIEEGCSPLMGQLGYGLQVRGPPPESLAAKALGSSFVLRAHRFIGRCRRGLERRLPGNS